MADAYLPVIVEDLPASFVFQPDGAVRQAIRLMPPGLVKVIAGAEKCHVIIDIKRPYYRPLSIPSSEF